MSDNKKRKQTPQEKTQTPQEEKPKKKKYERKKRNIRPAKYKRFLKFMQENALPLDNIQKFEVFDLKAPDDDTMPWGKYAGENIIDLWKNLIEGGRSYLMWLYKQDIKHLELREKLEELRRDELLLTGIDPCLKP
jgi:uncharacterized protein (DUF3820 family)|tara:strand:- start:2967 stop:3371 length:405 start_codon:yes stop_codon:yes gene_type:complete